MKEWTIYEDGDGDYSVYDEYDDRVIHDTSYYPTAPSLVKAYFIVDAVNFYLRHLAEQEANKQEDED